MSKCKCECKCCNKPSFSDVTRHLEDLDLFRKLDSALVLDEDEYVAYCDGLRPSTTYRDPMLYERGIDNRMFRGRIVVPTSVMVQWGRNHVTP